MRHHGPWVCQFFGIARGRVKGHSPRAIYFPLVVLINALFFAVVAPHAQAAGQLSVSPSVVNFGNVVVGKTQTINIRLTNSGNSALILSGHTIRAAGFHTNGITYPMTLAAGVQIPLSVTFSPTKTGSWSGTVQFVTTGANGSVQITLEGAGVASAATGYLSAAPLIAQFQNVAVGTHNTEVIQLTNTGSAPLTVSNVATTGSGFSASGLTPPLSIGAGATVQLTVGFLPQSVGSSSGSVALTSTASDSHMTIVLSGSSVGSSRMLTVSPASVAFGNVAVNGSAIQQLTLKNAGNSNISISGGSSNGTGLSATGLAAETLAPGQTAVVTAEFTPKATGSITGGITILSNASNGASITVPVTGTGVVATRVVKLQWQPSSSTGVVGYHVYRSTVSGGPYTNVTGSLIAGTSFSDSNVISGTAYYYVVTAVATNGNESSYSAQVEVSVP
jgi:Abnormal spindle-like microcephaly-assoc'd, ASPM-SPD-2-Hydin